MKGWKPAVEKETDKQITKREDRDVETLPAEKIEKGNGGEEDQEDDSGDEFEVPPLLSHQIDTMVREARELSKTKSGSRFRKQFDETVIEQRLNRRAEEDIRKDLEEETKAATMAGYSTIEEWYRSIHDDAPLLHVKSPVYKADDKFASVEPLHVQNEKVRLKFDWDRIENGEAPLVADPRPKVLARVSEVTMPMTAFQEREIWGHSYDKANNQNGAQKKQGGDLKRGRQEADKRGPAAQGVHESNGKQHPPSRRKDDNYISAPEEEASGRASVAKRVCMERPYTGEWRYIKFKDKLSHSSDPYAHEYLRELASKKQLDTSYNMYIKRDSDNLILPLQKEKIDVSATERPPMKKLLEMKEECDYFFDKDNVDSDPKDEQVR